MTGPIGWSDNLIDFSMNQIRFDCLKQNISCLDFEWSR